MVGLAETRRKGIGVRTHGEFIAVASSADEAGNYGCELWLNKARAYVQDGEVQRKLQARHVAI
eukprot:11168852-Lingulodinium_polyedra.AAC.1